MRRSYRPGWTAMGCVLLAVMIHHEKKAYVVMLSSEDCTAMRETLEQEQIGLNYRPEDASLRLRATNAQINEKEKRHMSSCFRARTARQCGRRSSKSKSGS